jgi:hypothetical protein
MHLLTPFRGMDDMQVAQVMREQLPAYQEIKSHAHQAHAMASEPIGKRAIKNFAQECVYDSQHALARYSRLFGQN